MKKKLSLLLVLSWFSVLLILFQNFDVATPIYTAAAPSSLVDTFEAPFGCSVANQYTDCTKEIRCPAGYYPEKMRAICNLESGYVDRTPLQTMSYGEVRVVQASTTVSDGLCTVDQTSLNYGSQSLPTSREPVYGDFRIHCHEKDTTSGSDCFVAGDMVCRRYDGPMFMHKIEFNDTSRGPQGVAKIGEDFWLVTQDMFSKVRFSLTSNQGKTLKDWTFEVDSHGQSLFVRKTAIGSYDVFIENPKHDGFLQYLLSADLTSLTPVRNIQILAGGQPFVFDVFGVDESKDRIVFLKKIEATTTAKAQKIVSVMKLSSALNKVAEPTSPSFNVTGAYGSLQGIATVGGSIYILFGNTEIDTQKWIYRTSLDGKSSLATEISVGRELARKEGTKFEPEAIHVDSNYAYFSMVSSAWNRFFRLPLKGL